MALCVAGAFHASAKKTPGHVARRWELLMIVVARNIIASGVFEAPFAATRALARVLQLRLRLWFWLWLRLLHEYKCSIEKKWDGLWDML